MLTPDGTLIEANSSALEFAGTSYVDTVNRPFWEAHWWNCNKERMDQLKEAIQRCAGGEFIRYEVELQGEGDKTAIVDFSLKPVFDQGGTVTMLVPEGRDITDLKQVEALLLNTQKLESLGVLAEGIAHDFNNLLTGVFGYIDLAAASTHETEVHDYLEGALNAITRVRGLTSQLLTFAKGGDPIKKLNRIDSCLKENVKFALSGSNVSCRFEISEGLWSCEFDRNQIGQVIDNLVINAQQAMPEGGTIVVSAQNMTLGEGEHAMLSSGNYVVFKVTDSGIGIKKEFLARIFDPFFTTKSKGHGLGLATCYSIVNRHNGCIDVASTLGSGTVFTVFLLATVTDVTEDKPHRFPEHSGEGTIIIMDDEKVILDTASKMLQLFGYTTVEVGDGRELLQVMKEYESTNQLVKALIVDLTVPGGMGGKETIFEIRKQNNEIPVFVTSGYADDPVMADPVHYGFTASISKPFTIKELMVLLQKYLKK